MEAVLGHVGGALRAGGRRHRPAGAQRAADRGSRLRRRHPAAPPARPRPDPRRRSPQAARLGCRLGASATGPSHASAKRRPVASVAHRTRLGPGSQDDPPPRAERRARVAPAPPSFRGRWGPERLRGRGGERPAARPPRPRQRGARCEPSPERVGGAGACRTQRDSRRCGPDAPPRASGDGVSPGGRDPRSAR